MAKCGHHEAVVAEVIRLLKHERERRKMSNYAVSQISGVSESMLSLVERGLRNPSLELLLCIAAALGVKLSQIIKKAEVTLKLQLRNQVRDDG